MVQVVPLSGPREVMASLNPLPKSTIRPKKEENIRQPLIHIRHFFSAFCVCVVVAFHHIRHKGTAKLTACSSDGLEILAAPSKVLVNTDEQVSDGVGRWLRNQRPRSGGVFCTVAGNQVALDPGGGLGQGAGRAERGESAKDKGSDLSVHFGWAGGWLLVTEAF